MTTINWKTATDEQVLEADLIIEKGLDTLPSEEIQTVLQRMNDAVQTAALTKSLGRIDPAKRDELQVLISTEDAQQLRDFLQKEVPDFDAIYQEVLILYKRVMLTGELPETAAN